MVTREIVTFVERFNRPQAYTTTPGPGGWTIKDTSAAGTPTYLNITEDGGAAKLLCDNTSEAQVVTLYHNDVLMFDVARIHYWWWILKVAGLDAVTTLTAGMGSARNDTDDTVATNMWARVEGSVSTSAIVVETDDATTDLDDKATGVALSSTYLKVLCDLTNGLADVRFFINGARVAVSTTFTLAALTAGLNVQPLVQLQKASGTGVPSVTLAEFGVQYEQFYGT